MKYFSHSIRRVAGTVKNYVVWLKTSEVGVTPAVAGADGVIVALRVAGEVDGFGTKLLVA